METKTVLLASDHAGYELKEHVKEYLTKKGISFLDTGAKELDPSDDYPKYAANLAKKISQDEFEQGILICGTGIGASIAANRFKKVRAALCMNEEMAYMARKHNNANVLVMGGRTTPFEEADKIMDTWFHSGFEGGRHSRRTDQLDNLE